METVETEELRKSKRCPRCGKEQPIEEFTRDKSRPDGRETYCRTCKRAYSAARFITNHGEILAAGREYNRRPEVKQRKREYEQTPERRSVRREEKKRPEVRRRRNELRQTPEAKKKQQERDRERNQRPKLKEAHRQQVIRYAAEHPEWKLVQRAKQRAKKKGVPFDVLPEDIVIPEFCPVFGVPLKICTREKTGCSPSIDEIIPGLGYVKGNVAIISDRANTLKNDGTAEEHYLISDWMKARNSGLFAEVETHPATTDREKRVIHSARQRAKDNGVHFDLSMEDVEFPEFCPVFKVRLVPGTRREHNNSPSLDRTDASKGYTKNNIAIICHRANFVKNDGTSEEHRKIADWMSQAQEQQAKAA